VVTALAGAAAACSACVGHTSTLGVLTGCVCSECSQWLCFLCFRCLYAALTALSSCQQAAAEHRKPPRATSICSSNRSHDKHQLLRPPWRQTLTWVRHARDECLGTKARAGKPTSLLSIQACQRHRVTRNFSDTAKTNCWREASHQQLLLMRRSRCHPRPHACPSQSRTAELGPQGTQTSLQRKGQSRSRRRRGVHRRPAHERHGGLSCCTRDAAEQAMERSQKGTREQLRRAHRKINHHNMLACA
jgi:hypothetical protein